MNIIRLMKSGILFTPQSESGLSMKLANQIIFLGASSVSFLFIVIATILYIGFPGEQEKLLTQGALSLTENLRRHVNPMVLTEDRLSLNDALAATKLSDENIIYIFVLGENQLPLASTYSKGVPKDLIDFVCPKNRSESTVKFSSLRILARVLTYPLPLWGTGLGKSAFGILILIPLMRLLIKAF